MPEGKPAGDKKKLGLIIGGIVGVLVLIGAIVFLGMQMFATPGFEAGSCVRQEDTNAVAISCDEAGSGDYKITKEVDDRAKCEDPTQPVVELGSGDDMQIYCLSPIGEPAGE
ncbi:hypothetical protein [Stackebrandtia soli]|uniref:hypothetical protein n=1 Tax=Stackebrandtia soli TaxID=1892856 RepID=UPI0039EB7E68